MGAEIPARKATQRYNGSRQAQRGARDGTDLRDLRQPRAGGDGARGGGRTEIERIYNIDRGYEAIEEKMLKN